MTHGAMTRSKRILPPKRRKREVDTGEREPRHLPTLRADCLWCAECQVYRDELIRLKKELEPEGAHERAANDGESASQAQPVSLSNARRIYELLDGLSPGCGHSREEALRRSRPCLYVSCRHNLYLDIVGKKGGYSINRGEGVEPEDIHPNDSCVLDIVDGFASETLDNSEAQDVMSYESEIELESDDWDNETSHEVTYSRSHYEVKLGTIARLVGVSRERVRQMEDVVLAKIRLPLRLALGEPSDQLGTPKPDRFDEA